ncbi:hypothetical protein L0337_01495 [candidate division KSB1 bacterium]|nr:hypothetical protein [candidate division KSB1 bacterium]
MAQPLWPAFLNYLKSWGEAATNSFAKKFRFLRQNRRVQVVFFVSLLVPVALVFVLTVMLPVGANPFAESAEEEPKESAEPLADSILTEISTERRELAEKMATLEIDQAFWQTRLQLANGDSISLSVDLIDSVASLEVKGVPMRQCKILRYRRSGVIKRLRAQGRLQPWLSKPFVVQKELATLLKAPIRIKEAPKDTIEASESKGQDLPIEHRDAEFTLHFDRSLTLVVEQAQPPSFKGRLRRIWYDMRRVFGDAGSALVALLHLQLPQHRIWIEIELSREDAKAIYRALPSRAGLALRL